MKRNDKSVANSESKKRKLDEALSKYDQLVIEHEKSTKDCQKLTGQIGIYSNDSSPIDNQNFVNNRLEQDGIKALYDGISKYKRGYENLIKENYPNDDASDKAINNKRFFREKFIQFMAEKNASSEGKYNGDPDIRATNPEQATVSMTEFLGVEGAKLYQLALEEEMNSFEYMNAVFKASTTHFAGEKWAERPIIFVAGPSGCGKSFAAQAAVEKAGEFLAKEESNSNASNQDGNDVVAVDGGIAREVSQIRKLVIQVANNKGYPGINDLHSKSKVLEGVKDRMQKAVLDPSTKVGVVIPETFSDFMKPILNIKKALLKLVSNLPGAKAIFCRVDGDEPDIFQEVVAYMGSRRAWKTSDFKEEGESLDLNNTKIPESKAYGASGFKFGQLGSYLAELWFIKHSKSKLSIKISNDLVLKRPEPLDSQNWVDAKQGEPGTEMFSKRVFNQWQEYLADHQKNPSLTSEEYAKKSPRPAYQFSDLANPLLTLKAYAKKYPAPSLIKTSGEMDFAIAKEIFGKRIEAIKESIAKETIKNPGSVNIKELEDACKVLDVIKMNMGLIGRLNNKEVLKLEEQLRTNIIIMKKHGDFSLIPGTEKDLNRAMNALKKITKEMSEQELNNDVSSHSSPPSSPEFSSPHSSPSSPASSSPSSSPNQLKVGERTLNPKFSNQKAMREALLIVRNQETENVSDQRLKVI
ncbi:hypothetical protein BN59_02002 [Legionella massiliensis]|uniref:Uncharacterized protein n=1 Tax=Legionella massiliensis TaxID=1034943 RepID=A0A078KXD1_9GAMM|nr:hypothetical protein [Legionella massiliensis]CDZ77712.1 hypothetical protein BN59_02002 [Legionella massiliensis]CEE13450.1 hypothetical protein BN1094_02002 [Legionella massiliensis]